MKQDLWRRAEALFHAALERPPAARSAFLDEACGGDGELRRIVEILVSKDEQAGSFLERPALDELTGTPEARVSLVGRQYGPYRILSLLGAGGMGEVYRARDTKLDREVAIKMLPFAFARDPKRLARLRQEARTLASLNHPNIAGIYGLEESPEGDFLVLELVVGETPAGPIALETALDYACQVAEALQAAHECGIVHRDLKPSNLKVTPQGTVKVLDFGLAKGIVRTQGVADGAESASGVAGVSTVTGHVLGTPGYMSPEQARGGDVDQRTDIWAFGCLLYELLAGRRAFESRTEVDTIAAVMELEPEWQALPARTPAKVRGLLRQCLHKDVHCRLNTMAAALTTLRDARRGQRRSVTEPGPASVGRRRPRAASRIRSLAVLPLTNFARDPEQDYFVDGMTEALIAELAQVGALRVISRTSAMHYKGTTKTAPEIARELGVDAIVEGSVMREGDRVRITAQLIHAATDRHLWARTYDRDMRDVLALQSEVALAIADEIQVTVTPQERARLLRERPVNLEAHEEYIRGRYHWGHAHPQKGIEHFQRTIAIDPDNAQAYAGIADAQCMLFGAALQVVPPAVVAPQARVAALKALELDASLAEPHVTLARVLFWHDRDPVGAERELRRAIQLNPNCAMAYFHLGMLLADLRRSNQAVAAFRRAIQLDPVSCWNSTIAGWIMFELGHEEAGKELLQKALELDPNFFYSWSASAVLHTYEGKYDEAAAEAHEGVRLSTGLPAARGFAAYVLGRAGRRTEALAIVDELEEASHQRYVPASAMAWAFAGLGDRDRTMEWLETGYAQRDSWLPHLALMQAFRALHRDARFEDLVQRLGLPLP
ncbi:MAG: protein kinase domain-containing protein [Bacteroidales bacterium]